MAEAVARGYRRRKNNAGGRSPAEKTAPIRALAEVAAYTAKDSEYMLSQEVFDVFYNALRGRQILTYNGLFTTGNKLFKAKQLNQFREKDTTEYV